MDETDVRLAALAGVNDLLLWHGLASFISLDENDSENKDDNDGSDVENLLENEMNAIANNGRIVRI